MVRWHSESRLRGAILAAASVLGLPVEVTDDAEWNVTEGAVKVGLKHPSFILAGAEGRDIDTAAAQTLLLLWESAREVKFAPNRRARRLALSRKRTDLEPVLSTIDRLFAVSELLYAMPGLRADVVRVVLSTLPPNPAELPRHLQWLVLLLAVQSGAQVDEGTLAGLEASVLREWKRVEEFSEGFSAREVLGFVLTPTPRHTPLRRFERAFALLVPAYERLLECDIHERGLDAQRTSGGLPDEDVGDDIGAGSRGGGLTEDAAPGEGNDDGVSDDPSDSARAGDRKDGAEGADLFAAEQAGFVEAVLATPLPASGDWPEHLRQADFEAAPSRDSSPRETASGAQSPGARDRTGHSEYREKANELATNIEDLRDVWRTVISERVGVRAQMSRNPTPEGDTLDRNSFVRIVSEITAGVERPNAYLSRERTVRRTRREGSTDYMLLIDRSASMQGAAASGAADAALIMLESLAGVARDIAAEERALGIDLQLSIRTALMVFDSTPTLVKPLTGELDDVVRRRMHAEIRAPQGSTNDALALEAAAKEFGIGAHGVATRDTLQRRRVLIFVSDGGTDDFGAASRQIRRLRAHGVSVFGIGIRTSELVARFAPSGIHLSDPSLLSREIAKLIAAAGLDSERTSPRG